MVHYFTVTLLALGLALVGTPMSRQLALRRGIVDKPGPRKIHLTPVPLLGALAIYTGVVLTLIIFVGRYDWQQIIGILAGASLLVVIGVLDDLGWVHNQVKLFIAMPLAALILMASGVRATLFPAPPLSAAFSLLADNALTLLWLVGITAAFSILDHMDGLCAGVVAVASVFFLLFAVLGGQVLVGTLAAALLGTSLGFLRWNFNPAKIFMGNGGAMFLGFMMATLSLKLRFPWLPHVHSWMIPVLILGVPIFDTSLVTISRSRRGLVPFTSPGKDHTAHRLANLGLGQRGAALLLYAVGGLSGLLALLVSRISVWHSYALAGSVILAALLAIVALERAPYER